jgi:hypothetical protein
VCYSGGIGEGDDRPLSLPAPPSPSLCLNAVICPCQMLPQPFICHSTRTYMNTYTHSVWRVGSSLPEEGGINREKEEMTLTETETW